MASNHFNSPVGKGLSVSVRDNNVDQALRVLKKRMQREGVFKEIKAKRHFVSASEQRKIDERKAISRRVKLEVKTFARENKMTPAEARSYLKSLKQR